MKHKMILSFVFSFIYFLSTAQEKGAAFQFEKTTHDFGTFEEAKGNVTYEFLFTNTGDAPLVIQNVQPSCGCTTPGWTREPILPGKTGFIKAEYNPSNRPGAFNKSLTITANTNPAITRLYIKGVVEPKPRTIADDFPTQIGGLRVKYRSFNLGKITTEKPIQRNFDVYNDSDKAITFQDKIESPGHIQVSFSQKTLKSKEKGLITVTYDPTGKKDLGFVSDVLILYTDETENPAKDFRVVATIEEYFPPMSAEDIARAPKLSFDKTTHDFGTIKQGESVTTSFLMTNEGKSDLNIRMVKANCGCTITELNTYDLKPGDSTPIKVTFDSRGRRGIQHKSITLFSNDPRNPTQMITIKANIEMDGGTR